MKALIVFGSKSDEKIFSVVCNKLLKTNIDFDLRILSAHRTLNELIDLIKKDSFDFVVAGAGLSAALPGVIAANTIKPVFGLPLNVNYKGLDSLLSIHQMPSGVYVIGLGVDSVNSLIYAVNTIKKIEKNNRIFLVERKNNYFLVKKSIEFFKAINFGFNSKKINAHKLKNTKKSIAIEFIPVNSKESNVKKILLQHKKNSNLCFFVPFNKNTRTSPLNLLRITKHGLWFGLNNYKNACLSALSFNKLNHSKLLSLRKKKRLNVLKADNLWRKKTWLK